MDDLPGGFFFFASTIYHYVLRNRRALTTVPDRVNMATIIFFFVVVGSGMLAVVSGERSSEDYTIQGGLLVCGDGMSCVKSTSMGLSYS